MAQTPTEEIKARLSIVDVISDYLKLESAGINFKARCPFHNEKTPSFFVSPERNSFYCFGCHEGGDIFTFIQKMEGIEFRPALQFLADRAGIKLDDQNNQRVVASQTEKLLTALKEAKDFYQEQLVKFKPAQDYLLARGVSLETQKAWQIGWAPSAWQVLYHQLASLGLTDEILIKAGLIIKSPKSGRLYDRFRGRIMFPMANGLGKVVAFSGRAFEEAEQMAKYINSPQTAVYDKSELLYGYDRAKTDIRRQKRAILVEGQFDLILSHQAGLTETVAVSGTALSPAHIRKLKRLTETIIIAFDADQAGFRAAGRAINLALKEGLEIKLVDMPAGQDPADIIKADPKKWQELVDMAQPIISFYLDFFSRQYSDSRILAGKYRTFVYPYIKMLAHATDQVYYIKEAATKLATTEEAVTEELAKVEMENLETREEKEPAVKTSDLNRKTLLIESLMGLNWYLIEKGNFPEASNELKQLMAQAEFEAEIINRKTELTKRKDNLIMAAELNYQILTEAELIKEINDLFRSWRREYLKTELTEIMMKLRQAEASGDSQAVDKYIKKCQDITQELNH